jgi:hypothetical protein
MTTTTRARNRQGADMHQVISITCVQTGLQCQRPVCLQGLKCMLGSPTEGVTVHTGWKCPICGKGNAPWTPGCANAACGINFTQAAQSAANAGNRIDPDWINEVPTC